jgi:hypothetical protein
MAKLIFGQEMQISIEEVSDIGCGEISMACI